MVLCFFEVASKLFPHMLQKRNLVGEVMNMFGDVMNRFREVMKLVGSSGNISNIRFLWDGMGWDILSGMTSPPI